MSGEAAASLGMGYREMSPRSARLALRAREETLEGVRWAEESGFSQDQVDEFRQLLGLVEGCFLDHNDIDEGGKIAEGSFGTIFKATFQGQKVAVKRILKDASGKKSLSQRMREVLLEVSVLSKIHHPNVVKFLGVAAHFPPAKTAEKGLFLGMVFELCEKGNLYQRLHENKGPRLSPDAKIRIAKDIATGMSHVHSLNIVHRDLSDRNVLISGDNKVKIADFGCARKINGESYRSSTISGSPAFMAPEQLGGKMLTLKADTWALGVIMWELITEKKPWEDKAPGKAIVGMQGLEYLRDQVVTKGQRLPQPTNDSLPHGQEAATKKLMDSLLQRNVAHRPSMAEALKSLEAIFDKLKAAKGITPSSTPKAADAKDMSLISDASRATNAKRVVNEYTDPHKLAENTKKLTEFYRYFNPKKLEDVPLVLKEYGSNMDVLNSKLRQRYQVDLDSFADLQRQQAQEAKATAASDDFSALSGLPRADSLLASPPPRQQAPYGVWNEELSKQDVHRPKDMPSPTLPRTSVHRPKDVSPTLPNNKAGPQVVQQQPLVRPSYPDQPTPGPQGEDPRGAPRYVQPREIVNAVCTMCPHKGTTGLHGFHEILLAGGARYKGTIQDGSYQGAGEVVLADGVSFPVMFSPDHSIDGAKWGGDAASPHEAQVFQLQQQVLALMQDISKGRAALKQQAMECQNERQRTANLEVLVNKLREDLENGRQREEGRLQYEELARKLQLATNVGAVESVSLYSPNAIYSRDHKSVLGTMADAPQDNYPSADAFRRAPSDRQQQAHSYADPYTEGNAGEMYHV